MHLHSRPDPTLRPLRGSALAWLRDNRGFLVFLLCFGLLRSAVADWNPVPTGSMRPAILEGDVVLVNRLAYDAKLPVSDISLLATGEPQRGDVVVFFSPQDGRRLIKRLVALPGDLVEFDAGPHPPQRQRRGGLRINGEAAAYSEPRSVLEPLGQGWVLGARRATETVAGHRRTVQWLEGLPAQARLPDPAGPLRVPPGHYYMLGDNRDNSADSRVFGPVPRRLLAGRAHRILLSVDTAAGWRPRLERFAAPLL